MEVNTNHDILVEHVNISRINELDFDNIPFGRIFSDHMFTADYFDGEWHDPQIIPYDNISLSPSATALHYGQAIFEGMKAYKNQEGNPQLFRPEKNRDRINISAHRMAMPEIPGDLFMSGLTELINIDQDWIPTNPGSSLYVRPFIFANDEFIGIKSAEHFKFIIFTCPVATYYTKPIKVLVSEHYVRAFDGGVGFAKAAGNYGATLLPVKEANAKGYAQLLWMDGKDYKYIQESGTMNIFFIIDGIAITPELNGTILDGVTRDSVMTLLKDKGVTVEERKISIDEVLEASKQGRLEDAFGTGTAVTLAHIESIGYQGSDIELPPIEKRKLSMGIKQELEDIKTSKIEDVHNWVFKI